MIGRRTLLTLAAASLVGASAAHAQATLAGVSYSTAMPVHDTKDFVDSYSWVGALFEGRRFTSASVSVGILAGWNEFYQKSSGTFVSPSGAVTGTQYRNIISIPVELTLDVYGGSRGGTRFYFGTGFGANRIRQLLDTGMKEFKANNWQLAVSPEIGILLPAGRPGSYFHLSARYHYPISGGDWLGGGARSFQYFSFSIGIMGGEG